jgi:DnaJ-domain-containing protein 1
VPEDYFALLDQPRRPWLDPGGVNAKFLALSSEVHPDRVHNASAEEKTAANERFATLNTAFNCLRDSKTRVRHLLEIERGTKVDHLEQLPPEAADFYFSLGQLCREIDQFLSEKDEKASSLLKVQRFQIALSWMDKLEPKRAALHERRAQLDKEMKALNSCWEAAAAVGSAEREAALPLVELEQIYREWCYLTRWSEQVQERLVQLSL